MIGLARILALLCLIGLVGLSGCAPEKKDPPPQDHFRSLTVRLNQVQSVVVRRNVPALDSLLVPDLRNEPEGADSLLHFVYGAEPDFQFESFANYQIFHTYDLARIDLNIAGSDSLTGRRATFTFELIDTLWYLKRWEKGLAPIGIDLEGQVE